MFTPDTSHQCTLLARFLAAVSAFVIALVVPSNHRAPAASPRLGAGRWGASRQPLLPPLKHLGRSYLCAHFPSVFETETYCHRTVAFQPFSSTATPSTPRASCCG